MPARITLFGKGANVFIFNGNDRKNSMTLRSEKGWRASILIDAAILPDCSKKKGKIPDVKLQQ